MKLVHATKKDYLNGQKKRLRSECPQMLDAAASQTCQHLNRQLDNKDLCLYYVFGQDSESLRNYEFSANHNTEPLPTSKATLFLLCNQFLLIIASHLIA